jgi:phage FluMu protein Com
MIQSFLGIQEIRKRFRTGGQGIVVQCPDCKAFNELGIDVG